MTTAAVTPPKRKSLADVQLEFAQRSERIKELSPATAVALLDYCEFRQWQLGVEMIRVAGERDLHRAAQIVGSVNILEELSAFMESILMPKAEEETGE